jgi:hypothetical protein
MTVDKDRKRIIRARMEKTGESYTAARAQILTRTKPKPIETLAAVPPQAVPPQAVLSRAVPQVTEPPIDYAALAGMSDDKVSAKTGRTWQEWMRVLDADGAAKIAHREIAVLVSEKHGVGDWWSQTVTVGYERIKGLRDRGQRRDGAYEAGRTKTFDVPVKTLFDAWASDTMRRRWLKGVKTTVRTATSPKTVRLQWPDNTIVVIGITPKGDTKSVVSVVHTKLPDKAASDAVKKEWTTHLDALTTFLTTKTTKATKPTKTRARAS